MQRRSRDRPNRPDCSLESVEKTQRFVIPSESRLSRSGRSYGARNLLWPKPKKRQIPRAPFLFSLLLVAAFNYGSGLHRSRSYTKRSEEHTSELQSRFDLVCRLLLE